MENENLIENTENTVIAEKKPPAKKFHTNVFTFVLSLVVAVFLWVYVMSVDAPNSEQTFYGVKVSVNNIERLNQESGLSVVSENENIYIDVVLQGKKSVLGKLSPDDIKAYVDVSAITEAGTHSLEIKYMPFPGGATFVSASSGTVSMVADITTTVNIPISVKFENSIIPVGYSVGDIVLNTEHVTVTGARTDVEKIAEAVIILNTGTLTRSVTVKDVLPVLCDKSGDEVRSEYVSYNREYVDVYVPIYLEKEIKIKVGYQHGYFNEKNTSVILSPSKILVRGDAEKVEALGDSITVGNINEKTNSNSFVFDITKSMLGDGVTVVTGTSKVIATVSYTGIEVMDFLVESENFKVNNPHKINYSLVQDGVVIKLRCPTGKLGYVNNENVEVLLDLSNLGSTENTVSAKLVITFKGELAGVAYELSAYSVDVVIER